MLLHAALQIRGGRRSTRMIGMFVQTAGLVFFCCCVCGGGAEVLQSVACAASCDGLLLLLLPPCHGAAWCAIARAQNQIREGHRRLLLPLHNLTVRHLTRHLMPNKVIIACRHGSMLLEVWVRPPRSSGHACHWSSPTRHLPTNSPPPGTPWQHAAVVVPYMPSQPAAWRAPTRRGTLLATARPLESSAA